MAEITIDELFTDDDGGPATKPKLPKSQEKLLAQMGIIHDHLGATGVSAHRKQIKRNIMMLRMNCFGEIDQKRITQWEYLLFHGSHDDAHRLNRVCKVLYGRDRVSVEMRDVHPFSGVVPQDVMDKKLRKLYRLGEYANTAGYVDFVKLMKGSGSQWTQLTTTINPTVTLIQTPYANTATYLNGVSYNTQSMTITSSSTATNSSAYTIAPGSFIITAT